MPAIKIPVERLLAPYFALIETITVIQINQMPGLMTYR
jgi:hypothetical protein